MWISVKERLPEQGQLVIAANSELEHSFPASFSKYSGWTILPGEYDVAVTHWMPLPEPPRK